MRGGISRTFTDRLRRLLQGGLPTDRLYAEWWLRSQRVARRLSGQEGVAEEVAGRVEVPAEIYEWKRDPEQGSFALALQTRTREALMEAFGRGLAAIGFERDGAGNGSYLLGKATGLDRAVETDGRI